MPSWQHCNQKDPMPDPASLPGMSLGPLLNMPSWQQCKWSTKRLQALTCISGRSSSASWFWHTFSACAYGGHCRGWRKDWMIDPASLAKPPAPFAFGTPSQHALMVGTERDNDKKRIISPLLPLLPHYFPITSKALVANFLIKIQFDIKSPLLPRVWYQTSQLIVWILYP